MHPADQVTAFAELAASRSFAAIAARFGAAERIVEQRLRLGNAAPELLDAYRADEIDLEALKVFAVTADRTRQLAVWEQVSARGYRPSAWQVKRLLTEERAPGASAIARFVGAEAYGAAGGTVMRDLFAEDSEDGVWFEDPALLKTLAMAKLGAAADELATRWKWAVPMVEVDWGATARHGRIEPRPGQPTKSQTVRQPQVRSPPAAARGSTAPADTPANDSLCTGSLPGDQQRPNNAKQRRRPRALERSTRAGPESAPAHQC